MRSCWIRATIRACRPRLRRPALWSMSLMVSAGCRRATGGCLLQHVSCIFSHLVLTLPTHLVFSSSPSLSHADESPAAMQKSGASGSCLRSSSLNFSLILALAVSAVVRWPWRWMGWLLGSGTLSLVHINYGGRQSISNTTPRRRHQQPQPQPQPQQQQQLQQRHLSQPMDS